MSDHYFRLFEAFQASLLGFHFQPKADGFLDIGQGLLASGALGMAARKIRATHGPSFVGLEEGYPVMHARQVVRLPTAVKGRPRRPVQGTS